ncbi:hypothetical protein ACSQ67_025876 [Phaseolus vulgaris]
MALRQLRQEIVGGRVLIAVAADVKQNRGVAFLYALRVIRVFFGYRVEANVAIAWKQMLLVLVFESYITFYSIPAGVERKILGHKECKICCGCSGFLSFRDN